MKIDKTSSTPSYLQIANLLKAEILGGRLGPGSRFPSDAELVSRFNLSRITVRKGVQILKSEGLVVRKQGLGTFVRHPISQDLTNVQTITEVLLGKGITPHVKLLSFGAVSPPDHVREALLLPDDAELLQIERLFFNKDESITRLRVFLPLALRDHADILQSEGQPTETTYTIWEKKLGMRIRGATYTLRAAKADRQDATCLGVEPGGPILVLDRVTYGDDGRPLDFAMFHYHWDRFEFVVTLPRVHLRDV
jgi:GntR family transcriptional regulator